MIYGSNLAIELNKFKNPNQKIASLDD